ncbi:hypothetical protein BSPWISOXPB_6367 [uncultured Gammaproteobacteria bacterium]|nr:hypothetical protein BSPWISOXPB_6367 [uncultured Gammaproteobacteria bacterium]
MLIALGIDDKGKREVLGVQVSLSEAEVYWREFLGDLQKRGMHGTKLIISDAHSSIKAARKAIMPGVAGNAISSIFNKMLKPMSPSKARRGL